MIDLKIHGYRIKVEKIYTGWAEGADPNNSVKTGYVQVTLLGGIAVHTYFTVPADKAESWQDIADAAQGAMNRLLMVHAVTTGEYDNGDR